MTVINRESYRPTLQARTLGGSGLLDAAATPKSTRRMGQHEEFEQSEAEAFSPALTEFLKLMRTRRTAK